MRPAVFLDRDGVLIEHVPYLRSVADLALIPGARAAVRALNEAAVPAVLVTNQSGVARALYSEAELAEIHAELGRQLEPARLDGIYYCPHLPPDASESAVEPYRVVCSCRKPAPGMLQRAALELDLDLARSLMIGDSTSDAEAGRCAGTAAALVRTGVAGSDRGYAAPEHVFDDIGDAIRWWLGPAR